MNIYKRGEVWWFRFTYKGQEIRKSTLTRDKKKAREIAGKVFAQIADNRWFPTEGHTLKELIERYDRDYTSKKSQPLRDKSIFAHLKKFFGEDTLLVDIERTIGDYTDSRKSVVNGTIMKELALLRRMFNLAIKWRWVKENPIDLIELPEVRDERTRYLKPDEYRGVIKALQMAPVWARPMIIVTLNTGLRLSNVVHLRWSQVDLASRLILIQGSEMKNGEDLGLPLTDEAYNILREQNRVRYLNSDFVFHDNGRAIYPVKLQRAFRQVCKDAGLTDFRFHDLRHTFASYLRQRGVDLHTIAKLLSHRDDRMAQRYAHLNVDNLRQAVAVLNEVRTNPGTGIDNQPGVENTTTQLTYGKTGSPTGI